MFIDEKSYIFCSEESNWPYDITGSGNNLMLQRPQVDILFLTSHDPIQIYVTQPDRVQYIRLRGMIKRPSQPLLSTVAPFTNIV